MFELKKNHCLIQTPRIVSLVQTTISRAEGATIHDLDQRTKIWSIQKSTEPGSGSFAVCKKVSTWFRLSD